MAENGQNPKPDDEQTPAVDSPEVAKPGATETENAIIEMTGDEGPEEWTAEDLARLSDEERSRIDADRKAEEAPPESEPEPEPKKKDEEPKVDDRQQQEPQQAFDISQARQGLGGVNAEIKALREKYADGEVDDEAFDKQLDTLIDRKADLSAGIKVAEKDTIAAQTQRLEQWYDATDAYKAANPELWSDANLPIWNDVLIATNQKYQKMTLTNEQRIRLAHREFNDIMGDVVPIAPADTSEPAPKKPRPNHPETPPSLARMPASEGSAAEGRFASVDHAIDAGVYQGEAAVANMTPAQQEAWLRSG